MNDRQQRLRELVAAERDLPPDLAAEARNWASIERRLIQGPGPPSLPEPGAAAAVLKWIGGLALVGGLVGGGVLLGSGPAQDPPVPGDLSSATGPIVQVDPRPEPVIPALEPVKPTSAIAPEPPRVLPPAPEPPPEPAPEPRPRTRPPRPDHKPEPVADAPAEPLDLAAELRLLASIRAALQRGDSAAALAGVAEHRRKFGAAGALVQERSAHEVEALCAAGEIADAQRLAAEFLRRYPDSTHRARVAAGCAQK